MYMRLFLPHMESTTLIHSERNISHQLKAALFEIRALCLQQCAELLVVQGDKYSTK